MGLNLFYKAKHEKKSWIALLRPGKFKGEDLCSRQVLMIIKTGTKCYALSVAAK